VAVAVFIGVAPLADVVAAYSGWDMFAVSDITGVELRFCEYDRLLRNLTYA